MSDLLIADRFVPLTPTRWFDLGTGARVLLRIERAGAIHVQAAWAERCAVLCGLWHPALLPCIDFGMLGGGHRFEAYRTDTRSLVRMSARGSGTCGVEPFLAAAGVPAPGVVDDGRGAAATAVAPAAFSMPEVDLQPRAPARPRCSTIGLRLVPRRLMQALCERLDAEPPPGWSLVDIAAPLGAGGRTLLEWCAREGRRRGWVPVASDAWPADMATHAVPAWVRLLDGRHVLVLHDGRHLPAGDRRVSQILLQLATARGSRHLLVRLVLPSATPASLALEPLPDPALAAAVIGVGRQRALAARVAHALASAHGLPGPFVAALFDPAPRTPSPAAYVVHETAEPYRVSDPAGSPGARISPPPGSPFEIRAARVIDLCVRGRHAAAERIASRQYAAAHRRGLGLEAADAARIRAALSRARGRSAAAREWLSRAAAHALGAGASHVGALVAIEQAHALIDLLDLDGADAAARTGETAASVLGDVMLEREAWLVRARLAWWRGEVRESSMLAHRVLAGGGHDGTGAAGQTAAAYVWRARAALAAADLPAARAAIRQARACVTSSVPPAAIALAEAAWLAAAGDVEGLARVLAEMRRVRRGAARAITAAAFDALAVEGPLMHGDAPSPRAVARLHQSLRGPLSPLLEARLQLALLEATDPARAAARRRRWSESGVHALLHVLPGVPSRVPADRARSPMLNDVVEVLRLCQEHDEPVRALEQLARFVLAHGRCAGVVVVAAARAPAVVAAVPNVPVAPAAARRAIETAAIVGPSHSDGAVEVAVPVRCAALTIGAIACRWLEAPPMELDHAVRWLEAVAVACAPCIQAVADRLDPPALPIVAQELLGESPPIEEVRRAVARAADAPYPVLIEGESGVGKELVARAIHRASRRRTRSFAALNCAALPDELVEAELFGHARGAFTGALIERRGLFEEADGGLLFLDEVGELSLRAQAKLLRALQEGEIRRIGETHARRVDVRVVAATNRTLAGEVEHGRFRRDLWYRLDVIHVRVPALRERPDDVPLLARAFWQRASERVGSRAVLGPAVLAALARYDWPGNVRELQNVIAALAVAGPRRGVVPGSCLPESLARLAEQRTAATLDAARRGFEARYVRAALARAGGHRGRAASELGLTRQGLVKLLERLGLETAEAESASDAAGHGG